MAPSGTFVCFNWTWPNYPPDVDAQLQHRLRPNRNVKRVSYQSEISPTTGLPHIQGYFFTVKPCQKATAMAYLPHSSPPVPGTININNFFTSGKDKGFEWWDVYTAKDASYDSVGAIRRAWGTTDLSDVALHEAHCQKGKGQGNRTDCDFLFDWLRANKTFVDLVDLSRSDHEDARMAMKLVMANGTQPRMAAQASIFMRRKGADLNLECIWLWGASGTGKTKYAHDLAKARNQDLFVVPDPNGSSHFYDGLCGQEIVLYDDFDGAIKFRDLIKKCDVYQGALLPIKGGSVFQTARTIIITSDKHPSRIYPNKVTEMGDDGLPLIMQLYRRFDSSKSLRKRRVRKGVPDGIRRMVHAPFSDSSDSEDDATPVDPNPFSLPDSMTAPGGQFA